MIAASAGPRRWPKIMLWVLAFILMAGAAAYQRLTGPTCPLRGMFRSEAQEHEYSLTRSAVTTKDTRVEAPAPDAATGATLRYRRYPLDEPLRSVEMTREDGSYAGHLPAQPAAGKLEYHVSIETPGGAVRVPASPEDDPIIRYKGPVPAYVLIPHMLLMFLAIMFGLRTGFAALFRHAGVRKLAFATLGLMTVGGMVFGPIVQKFAFGEFWTGFPNGTDLTDNKMLIMWLVWLGACAILTLKRSGRVRAARLAVAGATVVMLVVFLIPHSLRGSELDYRKLEEGTSAEEAIETG